MNILIVSSDMQSGGAETHILCLCRALLGRGHTLTLASSGGAIADMLSREGITCIKMPLTNVTPTDSVRALTGLFSLVRSGKFDVVHTHTRPAALYADIVCRLLAIPLVVTVHAHFCTRGVRGILTRTGERCIAVSADIAEHIEGVASKQGTRSLRVIPNGIDTHYFLPRGSKSKSFRVAFISRLDSDCSSGAHMLCNIAPMLAFKFPTLDIVIVGGGDEYEKIAHMAKKINAAHGRTLVRAVGQKQDILPFLQSADVLVGVSRAALEGMSCALPVVLCGDEGYLGLLDDEEKMRLAERTNFCCRGCKKTTASVLFNDIDGILSMSEQQRTKIGYAGRRYVTEHHSKTLMAKITEEEYRLARKGALLCGYYGYGNLGDEALLTAAKVRAEQIWGVGRVSALTRKANAAREYSRMSPVALIAALRHSGALVFGGGTLLQADTSYRSLWYYISLIFLARMLGRDVLLWGNGLQEADGKIANAALSRALLQCSYVGVRDRHSASVAARLGVPYDRIHLEDDLAAKTKGVDWEKVRKILLRMGVRKGQKYAIVAAKGSYKPRLFELTEHIKKLKAQNILPVYIAMYPREDARLAMLLKQKFGGACTPRLSPEEAVGLMRYAECVIASRYHAAVFARAAQAPVYIFGGEEKLVYFLK